MPKMNSKCSSIVCNLCISHTVPHALWSPFSGFNKCNFNEWYEIICEILTQNTLSPNTVAHRSQKSNKHMSKSFHSIESYVILLLRYLLSDITKSEYGFICINGLPAYILGVPFPFNNCSDSCSLLSLLGVKCLKMLTK